MYKIESDIPPPTGVSRNRKYPLLELDVGQSFSVPAVKGGGLRNVASETGRRTGRKFTVRVQEDGSVRCWRIA